MLGEKNCVAVEVLFRFGLNLICTGIAKQPVDVFAAQNEQHTAEIERELSWGEGKRQVNVNVSDS